MEEHDATRRPSSRFAARSIHRKIPLTALDDVQKMDAIGIQVGGDHYRKMAIQPIQYILANNLGYCEGNVVKYVSRWRDKGGVEDLRKARQYIDFLIEQETQ